MSDQNTIAEILDRAGVIYESRRRNDGSILIVEADAPGDRNIGHRGFFATFYFGPAGDLQAIGAWE